MLKEKVQKLMVEAMKEGNKERKQALNLYYNWRKSQTYSHITINDDGDPLEQECSPYVYHAERLLERSKLAEDVYPHSARYEV